MKKTFYFSHDTNAHSDPKSSALISEFGAEGYGVYWICIEMMSEQNEYKLTKFKNLYKAIAKECSMQEDKIEQIMTFLISECGLLVEDDEFIWSPSFLRRMSEMDSAYKARAEAGRRGGLKSSQTRNLAGQTEPDFSSNAQALLKHYSSTTQALLEHTASNTQATSSNKVNKSKVNKIKDNNYVEVVMTEHEQQYIDVLKKVEGYPLDLTKDVGYYRLLEERFPQVDLLEMVKDWAVYKLDNPLNAGENPRAQINTACKKCIDWGKCIKSTERKSIYKDL